MVYSFIFVFIFLKLISLLGDSNRSITNNDLNHLVYLDCAIKESLRLYPPVPYIGRETKEDIKIGLLNLLKGLFFF